MSIPPKKALDHQISYNTSFVLFWGLGTFSFENVKMHISGLKVTISGGKNAQNWPEIDFPSKQVGNR